MKSVCAKWMGPKFSAEAIHTCIILHGHYGYSMDAPLEQRSIENLVAQVMPISSNGGHWPLTQTIASEAPAASMTASAG